MPEGDRTDLNHWRSSGEASFHSPVFFARASPRLIPVQKMNRASRMASAIAPAMARRSMDRGFQIMERLNQVQLLRHIEEAQGAPPRHERKRLRTLEDEAHRAEEPWGLALRHHINEPSFANDAAALESFHGRNRQAARKWMREADLMR